MTLFFPVYPIFRAATRVMVVSLSNLWLVKKKLLLRKLGVRLGRRPTDVRSPWAVVLLMG